MRALFLGLILVNVLYWTWANSVDTPEVKVMRALDPDLPLLELIPRSAPSSAQTSVDEGDTDFSIDDDIVPVSVPLVGSDEVLAVDLQDTPDAAVTDGSTTPQTNSALPIIAPPTQSVEADATPDIPLVVQNLLAVVDPVDNPARCVSVGPFVSLRHTSEAAALLNQAGLNTSQRVEESQVWVGHWVYLPSFVSREAAVEVVEQLRKQGIKDIYIEPSGELENTVSLGLFTELERAEIRAGRVRKLGDVRPQIRNRSRDGLVYWIDAPVEAGISLDSASLPHNSSQKLRIETVDCPPFSARG